MTISLTPVIERPKVDQALRVTIITVKEIADEISGIVVAADQSGDFPEDAHCMFMREVDPRLIKERLHELSGPARAVIQSAVVHAIETGRGLSWVNDDEERMLTIRAELFGEPDSSFCAPNFEQAMRALNYTVDDHCGEVDAYELLTRCINNMGSPYHHYYRDFALTAASRSLTAAGRCTGAKRPSIALATPGPGKAASDRKGRFSANRDPGRATRPTDQRTGRFRQPNECNSRRGKNGDHSPRGLVPPFFRSRPDAGSASRCPSGCHRVHSFRPRLPADPHRE